MLKPHENPAALNILQVSTSDIGGGAEKIAWELHQEYRAQGHAAWLAVGRKSSCDDTIIPIPHKQHLALWIKMAQRLANSKFPVPIRFRRFCSHLAKIHHRIAKNRGYENFYFPGSKHLLELTPHKPDIVHCHNLHGLYFDLRVLPWLSSQQPVLLTLHDNWMLSGYCTYSFECDRWKSGCGHCPYIKTFPVKQDGTADNWQRKHHIYANSRVYVATPSVWLMKKVEQSMLTQAVVESRVIYNGMDLSVFRPVERHHVRAELGIPEKTDVILSTAAKIGKDRRKDYPTMREAAMLLSQRLPEHSILFLALGGDQPAEQIGNMTIRFIPFKGDASAVARYYQAADVYIHAAKADNLPNTVSEALACGTPVVATEVGGIPEQVDDGLTGFLVSPGDSKEMATAIEKILQDTALRQHMSIQAVETAQIRFDVNRMIGEYLDWYQEILV